MTFFGLGLTLITAVASLVLGAAAICALAYHTPRDWCDKLFTRCVIGVVSLAMAFVAFATIAVWVR